MLALIVASAENGAIGKNGHLPWHLPEDLRYFKRLTRNHTILMGRKTFESLPGVLPKREHVVITRDASKREDLPHVRFSNDLEQELLQAKMSDDLTFVIGGGQIYEAAFPYVQRVYLTKVRAVLSDADTYLKGFSEEDFVLVSESEPVVDEATGFSYTFLVYERAAMS